MSKFPKFNSHQMKILQITRYNNFLSIFHLHPFFLSNLNQPFDFNYTLQFVTVCNRQMHLIKIYLPHLL